MYVLYYMTYELGHREYVYSIAAYQKYLTSLGELKIFEPWRENDRFFQLS